jgi:small subunit ribosomal protein S1
LHISELADHKVGSPEEVVAVGDAIEVTVLRIDPGERKIGLSRKKAVEPREDGAEGEAVDASATAAAKPESTGLKGGLGGAGPLFSLGGEPEPTPDEPEEE